MSSPIYEIKSVAGTRECPSSTGQYITDQNLDQKFVCCYEDNLGFKHTTLTSSRDDCLARYGSGSEEVDECIPGIPISCGMLTVVAIGIAGAVATMLAALYVRRK